MNSAIEFHDSSVAAASLDAGVVELSLSPAYIHRSVGTPGLDSGEGHVGEVVLRFRNATVDGNLNLRGRISDGALAVNGVSLTLVPLPFVLTGRASLTLVLESGAKLEVHAPSVEVASVGPTKYVEPFPG